MEADRNTEMFMKKVDEVLRLIPSRGSVKKENISKIRAQLLDILKSADAGDRDIQELTLVEKPAQRKHR